MFTLTITFLVVPTCLFFWWLYQLQLICEDVCSKENCDKVYSCNPNEVECINDDNCIKTFNMKENKYGY